MNKYAVTYSNSEGTFTYCLSSQSVKLARRQFRTMAATARILSVKRV